MAILVDPGRFGAYLSLSCEPLVALLSVPADSVRFRLNCSFSASH